MPNKRLFIRGISLSLLFILAFVPPGNKKAVVDVFIETYIVNGKAVPSFTDEKGSTHYSNKDFYMVTKVKGAMGGEVHYRFFLEHVTLTYPEDSLSKYSATGAPLFESSVAEMIDSANVPPDIFGKLPGTFTNPRH